MLGGGKVVVEMEEAVERVCRKFSPHSPDNRFLSIYRWLDGHWTTNGPGGGHLFQRNVTLKIETIAMISCGCPSACGGFMSFSGTGPEHRNSRISGNGRRVFCAAGA